MKRIILIFLVLCCFSFGNIFSQPNASISTNRYLVKEAAQKQLLETLEKIPQGQEKLYGFNNRDEFKNATLGELFRIYSINPDANEDYFSAVSHNEYRVPVIVNKEYRALITVAIVDFEWHIVDFGGTELAKQMGECPNLFLPSPEIEGVFLRVYGLNCDFIAGRKIEHSIDSCQFYPLHAAQKIIEASAIDKYDTYDITMIFDLLSAKGY